MTEFEKAYNRGIALYELKKYTQAEKEFFKAHTLEPAHFSANNYLFWTCANLKKYTDAETYGALLLQNHAQNSHVYYSNGMLWIYKNDMEKAEIYFKKALELSPELEYVLSQYAFVKYRLEKYDEALELTNRGLGLMPESTNCLNYKLMVFAQKCLQSLECEETINLLLRLRPEDDYTQNNVGNYFENIGKPKIAIEHYRLALRINPDNQSAKHSYNRLRKKPSIIMGIEVTKIEAIVFMGLYFLNLGLSMLFMGIYLDDLSKRNSIPVSTFISAIVVFVVAILVLPRVYIYLYLKYIKKKRAKFNFFDRVEKKPTLKFLSKRRIQFFVTNNYEPLAVILKVIAFIGVIIMTFYLLHKSGFVPKKENRWMAMPIILSLIFVLKRIMKIN